MEINGSNVLITGAGSGLGAATARKLTDLGARVAILDLSISKGQDVANSLEGGLFVEGYMEDMLAQTVFEEVDFFILDCNSPDGEQEVIKKYTKWMD